MTPEHRAKIAAAITGKKYGSPSAEHRAKLSAALKGKPKPPRSPEHIAKLAAAAVGRELSPESIAKRTATNLERRPLEVRFWANVLRGADNECWEWQGVRMRTAFPYGRIGQGHNVLLAHRVSWELHNGPILDGLFVLHHCDNPPCVNPAHLFLGTHGDNMRDMASKGRQWLQRG